MSQSKVVTRFRLNVLCWWTSEACKTVNTVKRNHNGGHDDVLLNCSVGCKKANCRSCTHSIEMSQALLQESVTSKWWWLSPKVEAWNFTKNKLLKLVNLMKIKFLFAG